MAETTPTGPERPEFTSGPETARSREETALQLLRTARRARGMLGDLTMQAELKATATELVGQLRGFLPPDSPCTVPSTHRELQSLIDNAAWIAVMMRSHNWVSCGLSDDLIQQEADEPVHAGERTAAGTIDALGKAMLPGSGIEGWVGEIAAEAARGDKHLSAVVKAAKYALHPTPLLVLNDTTRMLGEAVYARNVSKLRGYVASVQAILAPKGVSLAAPVVEEPSLDEIRIKAVAIAAARRKLGRGGRGGVSL
ncbi:hypothetical protein [Streptomyces sp. NBC_00328]|uniref:hypothetical protein n=1 Tax=Streptomyces sp. NBC_00328 TaxID=2903646 RepID=UPI002E286B2A|nr:hypothetical protein [Streptomyces sp. NBC_00328]